MVLMLTITIMSIKMNEYGISYTLYVKKMQNCSKLLRASGISPDSKESNSNIVSKESVIVYWLSYKPQH